MHRNKQTRSPNQAAIFAIALTCGLAVSQIACGPGGNTGGPLPEAEQTLQSCTTEIADDAPEFYKTYFKCVRVEVSGDDVTIWTDGVPPHKSAYYPEDHANYVEFDFRGDTHFKNPNELGSQDFQITVPATPTAKGIAITADQVDSMMNTSDDEFGGGGQGVALNGVIIFAAMAAPGDDLADEQFTFDLYEGHPAGSTYHYHFNTPGPLEVLEAAGLTVGTVPGSADVEVYGILCDGTLVLGCTELDGTAPDDADFDAQNGHVHDIGDGTTVHFSGRYHTHVCPGTWPDHPFFPEIAYYDQGACPRGGP